MGKNTKHVKQFIEDIPDAKLQGITTNGGTIFKDKNFRLDMQGVRIFKLFKFSGLSMTDNWAPKDDIRQTCETQSSSPNQQWCHHLFS